MIDINTFYHDIKGLVHVGANGGDERNMYHDLGLNVLWIEAIPSIAEELKHNIEGYENQVAYQALVTDEDNKEYTFHLANNNGMSSSIYDLKEHTAIWPEVDYIGIMTLKSLTLSTLYKQERIDLALYQALVLDTQGSELLVLKGALDILHNFKYIRLEVADFESYGRCCQLPDIKEFMDCHGYKEMARLETANHPVKGHYYEVVYQKDNIVEATK